MHLKNVTVKSPKARNLYPSHNCMLAPTSLGRKTFRVFPCVWFCRLTTCRVNFRIVAHSEAMMVLLDTRSAHLRMPATLYTAWHDERSTGHKEIKHIRNETVGNAIAYILCEQSWSPIANAMRLIYCFFVCAVLYVFIWVQIKFTANRHLAIGHTASFVIAQKRLGGVAIRRPLKSVWWSSNAHAVEHPFFSGKPTTSSGEKNTLLSCE